MKQQLISTATSCWKLMKVNISSVFVCNNQSYYITKIVTVNFDFISWNKPMAVHLLLRFVMKLVIVFCLLFNEREKQSSFIYCVCVYVCVFVRACMCRRVCNIYAHKPVINHPLLGTFATIPPCLLGTLLQHDNRYLRVWQQKLTDTEVTKN